MKVALSWLKRSRIANATVARRAGWVSDEDWRSYLASLSEADRVFAEAAEPREVAKVVLPPVK